MGGNRKLTRTIVVVGALACAMSARADGACSESERDSFFRALRATTTCAARALRSGGPCPEAAPPACARDEMDSLLSLIGYARPAPAASAAQVRCQVAVYKAAYGFLKRRVAERARGARRQQASLAAMRLGRSCDVPISAGTPPVPTFDTSCLSRAKTLAGPLSGAKLERCLRPRLEAIAGTLLGEDPIRPNIVLIVTDDQHPAALQTMPAVVSRVFDEGVRFDNAFTTTPICAPSRAGLLTGRNPAAHGVHTNIGFNSGGARNFDESSTLATWLQAGGYRTALIGKYLNGYSAISPRIPAGWDEWRVFVSDTDNFFDYRLNENGEIRRYGRAADQYSTDVLARQAQGFIRDNRDAPLFLMWAPSAPHPPSTPAPRHAGTLSGAPKWRPPNWAENVDDKPGWLRAFAAGEEKLRAYGEQILRQRESLLAVDEAVASLLDLLEEEGLADNTVVVFTSDHGTLWGEHRWLGKQVPYEESIGVPLAIRYPVELPARAREKALVTNLDVAPPLAGFAGVAPGRPTEGRNLAELLEGADDWRREIVIRHHGGIVVPPWSALRTTRYKYVDYSRGHEELYDLAADPYELQNQFHNSFRDELRKRLARRLDELLSTENGGTK